MAYDRDAAIGYAKKYWDRPCDDGIFWRSDYAVNIEAARKQFKAPAKEGWEARFVPDGSGDEHAVFRRPTSEDIEIQEWIGLADCAHFLTRCISAGGMPISEKSVPKMITHLKARADTKILAERVTRERGQRIVNSGVFKKGDMVGYFNIDPRGDYGGRRQYSHSTMYVGKLKPDDDGRITCHTKSRFGGLSSFPDEWHLQEDSYAYTFIHIAQDDVAPPRRITAGLSGWWSKSGGAGYFFLRPNGRATFTLRPPGIHLEAPRATLDTGYWFLARGVLTFFWKKSGNVEKWRASGRPDQLATSVNDVPGPTVTKMVRAAVRHRRR